ncbi:hypothetical protein N9L68_01250 [bacterium]|nr:hypothetical protein [bacterium]
MTKLAISPHNTLGRATEENSVRNRTLRVRQHPATPPRANFGLGSSTPNSSAMAMGENTTAKYGAPRAGPINCLEQRGRCCEDIIQRRRERLKAYKVNT